MTKPRLIIAALSLSAAAFVGIVQHEGYTDKAVIPIPGDRPTVGFGSTFKEDGSPVKMGDTITPQKAVSRSLSHIAKDESVLKQCVKSPLTQTEYDVLVEFSYWFGAKRTCNSDIVRHINSGSYVDACAAYLLYRKAAGKDCSIASNKCSGVWKRAQERNIKCLTNQ